jgi:hypothetical protein
MTAPDCLLRPGVEEDVLLLPHGFVIVQANYHVNVIILI